MIDNKNNPAGAPLALGSDHAGYNTKEAIKQVLAAAGVEFKDFGTHSTESCDYPDFARAVAEAVSEGEFERGILCCGSGIGVSMVANKVRGVRAAVCHDENSAELSRLHNDANILCLGERTTPGDSIPGIVSKWLDTAFEGGRHQRRVDKFEHARGNEPGAERYWKKSSKALPG
ncbi:MAG: ribose 5-phosphate isomerase B [Candidatus Obscuribacterales bacterium]